MSKSNNYIINILNKKLNSKDIDIKNLTILNKGKFGNAFVYRYKDTNLDYTIKDFYHCPFFIRVIFGRIMARIEYKTLKKLHNISGIASEVSMLSPFTVAFTFINGKSLNFYDNKTYSVPVEFFLKLEKLVAEMHKRDIIHLDLRNLGNILLGEDKNPYIIDFQSSITSKRLPKKIRKTLENSDISGIYKAWSKVCFEPLPLEKQQFLDSFNSLRKFWIFKGYPISKAIKKLIKYNKRNISSFYSLRNYKF